MQMIAKRFFQTATALVVVMAVPSLVLPITGGFPVSFVAKAHAAEDFTLESVSVRGEMINIALKNIVVKGSSLDKKSFEDLLKAGVFSDTQKDWLVFSAGSVSVSEINMVSLKPQDEDAENNDKGDEPYLDGVLKNINFQNIEKGKIGRFSLEGTHFTNKFMVPQFSGKQLFINATLTNGMISVEDIDMPVFLDFRSTTSDSANVLRKRVFQNLKVEGIHFKGQARTTREESGVIWEASLKSVYQSDVKVHPYRFFPLEKLYDNHFIAEKFGAQDNSENKNRYLVAALINDISAWETSGELTGLKVSLRSDDIKPSSNIEEKVANIWLDVRCDRFSWAREALEMANFGLDYTLSNTEKITSSIGLYSRKNFSYEPTLKALEELYARSNIASSLKEPSDYLKFLPQIGQWDFKDWKADHEKNGKKQPIYAIKSFHLDVKEQTHGVPTTMQWDIEDLLLPEQFWERAQMFPGITAPPSSLVSFHMDYAWDKKTQNLIINNLESSLKEFGTFALTASFRNVSDKILTFNQASLFALASASVDKVGVTLTDKGGMSWFGKGMSEAQNTSPEAFWGKIIATMELSAPMFLGDSANAKIIIEAAKKFITNRDLLSLSIKSLKPRGLDLTDFALVRSPKDLLDFVTVEAKNQ